MYTSTKLSRPASINRTTRLKHTQIFYIGNNLQLQATSTREDIHLVWSQLPHHKHIDLSCIVIAKLYPDSFSSKFDLKLNYAVKAIDWPVPSI